MQVYAPRTDPPDGAPGRETAAGGSPDRGDGRNAEAAAGPRTGPETGPDEQPEEGSGRAAAPSGPPAEATRAFDDPPPAFRALKDRELARLGVPPAMLAEVRAVRGEKDLDAMQARLPVEAWEALFLYLAGETYERLVLEREAPAEPVDTGDFAKALERDESRARFIVVEDELELEAMLNAPLERWRVFLHPSQRRLVERRWNGPVRVLGGAGTGKTVVAMHRARRLARGLLAPRAAPAPEARSTREPGRILFTPSPGTSPRTSRTTCARSARRTTPR